MSRGRRRAAALGALVAVGLLVAIWMRMGGGDEGPPPPAPAETRAEDHKRLTAPVVIEAEPQGDESAASIVAIEVDQQETCVGGNVRFAVRVGGDDPRLIPRVGFGARKGPGAVGIAQQYRSRQEDGEDTLEVDLVDAITGEVVERRQVPVNFVACGEEEPRHELRPVCTAHASQALATCRLANDRELTDIAWELWPAYVDGDGPSVFADGEAVELELPPHEAGDAFETYMVSVRASGANGEALTGRTSIARERRGFKDRVVHGQLLLWAQQLDPTTHLLTNTSPEDLVLEETLTIEHRPCEAGGVARTTEVSTRSVIGSSRIAAHERREVRWDPPLDPGVCGLRAFLRGVGADSGYPVTGALRSR